MLRRFLGLTGFAVLAGALAACGSPTPAVQPTQPPATEAAQAPATDAMPPAPTPTAEVAATQAPPAASGAMECAWSGTGATITLGDKRLNFSCGGGDDYTVGLFGDITQGDKGWEITQAKVKNDPANPSPEDQKQVLVTHIILEDGTDCAFAGVGATTGINEKRLNYTCGQNGDYTIGLFGDVTLGDKGWEITKGEVKVTTDGPVSQNVSTVVIAKLGVEPE